MTMGVDGSPTALAGVPPVETATSNREGPPTNRRFNIDGRKSVAMRKSTFISTSKVAAEHSVSSRLSLGVSSMMTYLATDRSSTADKPSRASAVSDRPRASRLFGDDSTPSVHPPAPDRPHSEGDNGVPLPADAEKQEEEEKSALASRIIEEEEVEDYDHPFDA